MFVYIRRQTIQPRGPPRGHLSHSSAGPAVMRFAVKAVDKMRCFRKRSALPVLAFLITSLLVFSLYVDDEFVLVSQEDLDQDLDQDQDQDQDPGPGRSVWVC
ncbi:unnamed protein product [Merluccius merluccius]